MFMSTYIHIFAYVNRKKKEQNLKNIDIMRINSDSRCMLSIYLSNLVLQTLKGGLCDRMLVCFVLKSQDLTQFIYISVFNVID